MYRPAFYVGLMLALIGCGTMSTNPVKVYLYPDGHLQAYTTRVNPSEIPELAKEIGRRPVRIIPQGEDNKTVTLTQAAAVRDALKAAGVHDVTIAIAGE